MSWEFLDTIEEKNAFHDRLELIPAKWRGPTVDVIDTIESVKMGLAALGIDDNFLLIEATRLVLKRHDKATDLEQ